MDRYKQIHILFLGLVPAAILGGFTYKESAIDLNVILLALLLIAMRAKFFIDDEAYFHDVQRKELPGGTPYMFGLVVAVLSWVLWVFAGFFIKDVERASLLMILTLVPSTIWIVAAMVKRGAYAEQVPWLFFNLLYGTGFALIAFRKADWNPFQDQADIFTTVVLMALIVVFLFDFVASRLLESGRFEARKTRQAQAKSSAPPREKPKKKPPRKS
jgi:uncharacterized membrane protein YfcA